MKRIITVLSMVVVLCLMLTAPLVANSPQTWQLDSEFYTPVYQMEKNFGPGDDGQTGQVTVPAGEARIWIADQKALADVTFTSGFWELDMVTDADWGINFDLCYVEVGKWDGSTFTALVNAAIKIPTGSPVGKILVEFKAQTGPITIDNGKWLALRIENQSNNDRIVYTGEGDYASCLTSPQTDPGYPLPELAAGILLGAGVLGLGGYLLFRRKKALVA